MTLREAIQFAVEHLEYNAVPESRRNAESLLMHAIGCDRAHLFANSERALSAEEQAKYTQLVNERGTHKPLQYITGRQEFWGLDFIVTPAVLIPRPETEHSVEEVLRIVKQESLEAPRIIDVGTGSGAIAIALASELRTAHIEAVDISPEALHVAQNNARRLGFFSVMFYQSDLLSDAPREYDIIVSNPPYVGSNEPDKVQREVREFEPKIAVFGGREGLDIYRRLIPQAFAKLKPGGWLVMEIGYSIEEGVRALMTGFTDVASVPDLQGIPRVVIGRKPHSGKNPAAKS